MAVCVAVFAGLVTLALLLKPFFREFETFQDRLDFALKEGWLSWLSDDWTLWSDLKRFAWFMCGLMVGLAVYVGLRMLFG